VHFDINKTVIPCDSIQLKGLEESIREGVSELFWGTLTQIGDGVQWEWNQSKPSSAAPVMDSSAADLAQNSQDSSQADATLTNYAQYCKLVIKTKAEMKAAARNFELVAGRPVKEEMESLVQLAMSRMQLEPDLCNTKEAEAAGLPGPTLQIFPALFHLAAALQRAEWPFAILFRSFGADHDSIRQEWNAFCELKHPIFSNLIRDLGPMDGSVPGIPDRRLQRMHTLYRDVEGPVLVLDTVTNGPARATWDTWAKEKPRPQTDTRNGREFIKRELRAATVDGYTGIRHFMEQHLREEGTAAIKDDWAWWFYNGQTAAAGKLLTLIGGDTPTQQLFFDDNIEDDDARIVDCRGADGASLPAAVSVAKICQRVNPVEVALDSNYFLRKLLARRWNAMPQVTGRTSWRSRWCQPPKPSPWRGRQRSRSVQPGSEREE